ncbi:MAG: hypothetical protein ACD_61C00019G0005 [uncultured bacterium]|nr:MAG: hypothetical protein ACD_61C00019G0005 [uncultured bacterium]
MNILVFTEGTIIMHKSAIGFSRKEIVRQSAKEGIQREAKALFYKSKFDVPVELNSVHDYGNYVPNGRAVEKLKLWNKQGAKIYYLSSRRVESEIKAVREVLKKYDFPDSQNLLFRKHDQEYADVAEMLKPDILIEDDCESIGGEAQMTYPHIRPEIKSKIKSLVVEEFGGIDHLPDNINKL